MPISQKTFKGVLDYDVMLGLMMNAVIEFARYHGGTIELNKIEREFGAPINFSDEKNYPDEMFLKLAEVVGKNIGCGTESEYHGCERLFAKFMHRIITEKYPAILSRFSSYRDMLLSINEIHHRIPLIQNPDKLHSELSNNNIVIHYKSPTKLDYFFDQLLLEFARQFSTKIEIRYDKMMTNGDDETVAIITIKQ